MGIIGVDFDTVRQLLITFSTCQILEGRRECNMVGHQLSIFIVEFSELEVYFSKHCVYLRWCSSDVNLE
jgi:hypothetical protein